MAAEEGWEDAEEKMKKGRVYGGRRLREDGWLLFENNIEECLTVWSRYVVPAHPSDSESVV